MMGSSAEVKAIFLDPLNAASRDFIVFAVNDHSMNSIGGSHWSLCVYSKPDNSFFNFDSSSNSNNSSCSKLVKILRSCLGCDTAKLENMECLQQNNCYDCGIFVLCHADLACQSAVKEKSLKEVKKLQRKIVQIKRHEVAQIILNLSLTN